MAAAGLEVGTGVVLIASPSLFTRLLFGAGLVSPAPGLARLGGFALFALVIACWPSRDAALDPALRGMLVFSGLVTAYLAYRGLRGGATGPLLWPAVALHGVFTILLLAALFRKASSSTVTDS